MGYERTDLFPYGFPFKDANTPFCDDCGWLEIIPEGKKCTAAIQSQTWSCGKCVKCSSHS